MGTEQDPEERAHAADGADRRADAKSGADGGADAKGGADGGADAKSGADGGADAKGGADGGADKGGRTRARIKRAALTLFAQKGLDGVSVREILRLAGQKNAGSINYHFSSRAELVDELIRDVAMLLDRHFEARLQALEASGAEPTIRDLALILTEAPTLEAGLEAGPETGGEAAEDRWSLRFLNLVWQTDRQRLFEAMRGLDGGTRRCLAGMRALAPPMPAPLLQQRLMLVMIFVVAAGSTREAAREDQDAWAALWGGALGRESLADSIAGIITAPPAPETLAALAREGREG